MARRVRRARKSFGYRFRAQLEALEDRRMLSVTMDLASRSHTLSGTADGFSSARSGAVSADGRYVAFTSIAPDLVSGLNIAPGIANVYRYDRVTREVVLVSINAAGNGGGNEDSGALTFPGTGTKMWPSISADGNIVVFGTTATNLHSQDTGRGIDIYARDVGANTSYLVSADENGEAIGASSQEAPIVSANGRVVVYSLGKDIFAYDVTTGQRELVSVNRYGTGGANESCNSVVVNADGTVVAFTTSASNLHALDTNGRQDVYARNRATGVTYLVSINGAGTNGGNSSSGAPRISADGNTILFRSQSKNLDLQYPYQNVEETLFARNLATGQTHLAIVNAAGTDAVGVGSVYNLGITSDFLLSANGRVVVFLSNSTNVHPLDTDTTVDVFARDLVTGITYFVSDDSTPAGNLENAGCYEPAISADGNIIAYTAEVSNLEVLVRNLATGATVLASPNMDGLSTTDHESFRALVSADGHTIVFNSFSTDLVLGDSNDSRDVFLAVVPWSTPLLPGDFNLNGAVDSADYVAWRKTNGTVVAPYSGADGSGNGIVGPEDYSVWRAHFGETLPAIGAAPAIVDEVSVAAVEEIVAKPQAARFLVAFDRDVSRPDHDRPLAASGEVSSGRRGEHLLTAVTLLRGSRGNDRLIDEGRVRGESDGACVETVDHAFEEFGELTLKNRSGGGVGMRVLSAARRG